MYFDSLYKETPYVVIVIIDTLEKAQETVSQDRDMKSADALISVESGND